MGFDFSSAMGGALQFGQDLLKRDWAKSDAADARQSDERAMERTMAFNSAEALANRDFQKEMSNTSWQRGTADMMAAGINPMLAFHQGGSSTPSGGQASASGTHATPARGTDLRMLEGAATAAQIDATQAQANKTRAEEKEVIARTPTHAVNIEQTIENIKKLVAETRAVSQGERTSAAQESLHRAQLPKIKEEIEHIKATVRQLSHQGFLTQSLDTEARQRINANLPQIERALKDVEREFMELERPRRGQESAANDRFVGALGALLRTLNPLGGLIRSVK